MKISICKLLFFVILFYSLPSFGQSYDISTFAGTGVSGYNGDSAVATAAELYYPIGVTIDDSGNVYVVDANNNRIRKINTKGVISTIAGNGIYGYSGDGGIATAAELAYPEGIALDDSGNVYVADAANNRIRKINTKGIISTIAGNGISGYSGEGGIAIAAELNYPTGLAIDKSGNLYIADMSNNRIREVRTTGIIYTVAGDSLYGYSGDGVAATSTELYNPAGVFIDKKSNLYITDFSNYRIRRVDSTGIISTIAGNGSPSYSGDGGAATSATLRGAWGIIVDSLGNIYFSDASNNVIRMINTSGIISTIAGNGTAGYTGDKVIATSAELNNPCGISLYNSNNIYIADDINNRIRMLSTAKAPLAGFVISDSVVYIGDSVQFKDTSIYSPTNWKWTFSGGNPINSNMQYPQVLYSSSGLYTVKLVASNAFGSDSIIKKVNVTLNPVPLNIAGNLYGMTQNGGASDQGVIFYYDPIKGKEIVVYSFPPNADPEGSLIQAKDGNLYGMTSGDGTSGDGTIFKYSTSSGILTTLVNFTGTNGSAPHGSLLQANDGNLYGMTTEGGTGNDGTIFKYDISTATLTTLASFTGTYQYNVAGNNLIQASDGNLYGMTSYCGSLGLGTLFKCTTTGTYTTLINFDKTTYGQYPYGSLIQGLNGDLYGMTESGGTSNDGIIFKYNITSATFINIVNFPPPPSPTSNLGGSLLQTGDSNLYGMTFAGGSGWGTIFKCTPTGSLSSLISFDDANTGAGPYGSLIMATDSNLYGMTNFGGISNVGTLFEYSLKSGSFKVLTDFNHTNGSYPGGDLIELMNVSISITPSCTGQILSALVHGGGVGTYSYNWSTGATTSSISNITSAGKYYVSVANQKGITVNDTVTLPAFTSKNGFDLTGNLYVCIDTPSFSKAYIQACIFNNRCLPTNGTLKLLLDTAFHITTIVSDSAARVNGDTLIWNYDSLSIFGKTHSVLLSGTVDSLPIGDSVFASMFITPVIGDSLPTNNSVTYWIKASPYNCVGFPFDPNEKSVSPEGNIKATQQITYTIHFQNTGTAIAHNVVVMDTLSPFVDPTTLKVISSSSPVATSITSGNIIKFAFDNINLSDTAMSKTTSIGIIKFTINPMSTDLPGEKIKNTAGIYFDFNPVVVTNTTLNTISGIITSTQNIIKPLNIGCFPNPFTTTTSIVFNTNGIHYLEINDLTGRKIETLKCTGAQFELSRKGLASGVYFLKAYDEGRNQVTTKKIVVE